MKVRESSRWRLPYLVTWSVSKNLGKLFLKIPDILVLLMKITTISILCHSQNVSAKIFMVHLFHSALAVTCKKEVYILYMNVKLAYEYNSFILAIEITF